MENASMDVMPRGDTGKGAARKLRQAGKLPGVLYGEGDAPRAILLDAVQFDLLRRSGAHQRLLDVHFTDGKQSIKALVREMQVHPVSRAVLHVDLQRGEIRNRSFQLSVGVKEAAVGAFFFGIFWNVSQVISGEISWLRTTLFVKLGIVLCLLLFSLLARRELTLAAVPARTRYAIVLMGIIEAAAVAVVNFGLTIGDAILITPVASALSLVTITLAIVFLKEKVTGLQGLGMVTAVFGIVVTAF